MAGKTRRARSSFGALRKLPSGRYQASYLDPHGNRVNAPRDLHREDRRRRMTLRAARRD